MGERKGP